ncbi:MAG TPA: ABC transporter substrate-binding protein [Chitinispirillaceae bacterium]|nr:ABC transporter substrate-binding protein [Chitinispirillaceae bacterium]
MNTRIMHLYRWPIKRGTFSLCFFSLTLALNPSVSVYARTITDMAGRTLSIKDTIRRVLPADPKSSILLMSAADTLLVARARIPGTSFHTLLSPRYLKLPVVDSRNQEEILAKAPDLIIAGLHLPTKSTEQFDILQKRTGVPVVVIDLTLSSLDSVYRFLGYLFDNRQLCNELAFWLKDLFDRIMLYIDNASAPEQSVYYALGANGLMTDPPGSIHTEVLDMLRLKNVASVNHKGGGHAMVSMEQILQWNPQVILTASFRGGDNATASAFNSTIWSGVAAVRNRQIYLIPAQPFGWLDHPSSVNRIAGLIWLTHVFYKRDIELTIGDLRSFYSRFYGYNMDSKIAHDLLLSTKCMER